MSDIVTWLASTPAERQRDRAISVVRRDTDVAVARVSSVATVAQAATMGVLSVSMMQREAAFVCPDAAAKLDLISTTAAIGMAGVLQRLAAGL